MKNYKSYILAIPAALAAVALPAYAVIDVSAVTTILSGDVTTAVTAVGGAVLAVCAIVMAFKFVKRAM